MKEVKRFILTLIARLANEHGYDCKIGDDELEIKLMGSNAPGFVIGIKEKAKGIVVRGKA
jgi:hypothetical protein